MILNCVRSSKNKKKIKKFVHFFRVVSLVEKIFFALMFVPAKCFLALVNKVSSKKLIIKFEFDLEN